MASSLIQLQSEIDSKALLRRVDKLEDPVSFLHDDVPKLSKSIYQELRSEESINLSFSDEFYTQYIRALAALESQGFIEGLHTIGKKYAAGIHLNDPSYIMYLCAVAENKERMEKLIKIVDACEVGKWLDGTKIKSEVDLPLPVIKAVFDIYESKGFGFCSKEIGTTLYMGKA